MCVNWNERKLDGYIVQTAFGRVLYELVAEPAQVHKVRVGPATRFAVAT